MSVAARSTCAGALLVLVVACPVFANQVWMSDCNFGFHDQPYGSHEVVCVTGELDCTDDWPPYPFPVADIYIVSDNEQNWYVGRSLDDAMGQETTVQGSGGGGSFWDVTVALPPLPVGRFDVVIDENMDGHYNACDGFNDYVLGNGTSCAFEVFDYGLPNMVDSDAIKAEAASQAGDWTATAANLRSVFTHIQVASLALRVGSAMAGAPTTAYALVAGAGAFAIDYAYMYGNPMLISRGQDIIAAYADRMADQHADLAADPPDSTYGSIVELGAIDYAAPPTDDVIHTTETPLFNAIAEEAALIEAIRIAHERFLGASMVEPPDTPDNQATRIQALALDEYCVLARDVAVDIGDAFADLRAFADTSGYGHTVVDPDSSIALQERVLAEGFYPEELSIMLGAGFDSTDTEAIYSEITSWDLVEATEGSAVAHIDSTIQSNETLIASLEAFIEGVGDVLDATSVVWIPHPTANAGGPYNGPEGSAITFDGSGSTDPLGGELTYEWDFDADGAFGDQTGAEPEQSWEREGRRLVGLKVTNPEGDHDVDYARVVLTPVNGGPVFESLEPDSCYIPMADCDSLAFSAVVVDPDGDDILYEWTLDDSLVSSADSWTLDPEPVAYGRRRVTLHVSDGSPLSPDNSYSWRVDVPGGCTGVEEHESDAEGQALAILHAAHDASGDRVNLTVALPRTGDATLSIYNVAGRLVRSMRLGQLDGGEHEIAWDMRSSDGRPVSSGVYLCRFEVDGAEASRKVTIVR